VSDLGVSERGGRSYRVTARLMFSVLPYKCIPDRRIGEHADHARPSVL